MIRLNERDVLAHLDLARVLRVRGDLASAEQAYGRAVALAPDDANAVLGRGLVRMEQGLAAAALLDLQRAVALAPRDPAVWLALGDLRRASADLPAAVEAYERALELEPGAIVAEVRLGNTRITLGDFAGAVSVFDRVLARAPGMSEAHNGRGVALMYSERTDEARVAFERAAALAPADPHPLLNLGILGERAGQHELAARAFQAALDRDPDSEDALRRLLALRAG